MNWKHDVTQIVIYKQKDNFRNFANWLHSCVYFSDVVESLCFLLCFYFSWPSIWICMFVGLQLKLLSKWLLYVPTECALCRVILILMCTWFIESMHYVFVINIFILRKVILDHMCYCRIDHRALNDRGINMIFVWKRCLLPTKLICIVYSG